MATFAERRALLGNMMNMNMGRPPPAVVAESNNEGGEDAPHAPMPPAPAQAAPPPPPPEPPAPKHEFPEPPGPPPAFDKKLKKSYPSKKQTGTEGCPAFHQFITENAPQTNQAPAKAPKEPKAPKAPKSSGGGAPPPPPPPPPRCV